MWEQNGKKVASQLTLGGDHLGGVVPLIACFPEPNLSNLNTQRDSASTQEETARRDVSLLRRASTKTVTEISLISVS